MIKLERTRTKEAIAEGLRGTKRQAKAVLLLNQFYSNSFDFKSDHWKKAKPQLIKESFGKCAYCEAPTNAVAHGDVEHFRPKSVYWWLAYCYDNYSYSCQICNQTYKSNKFPPHDSAGLRSPNNLPAVKPDDVQLSAIATRLFPDPLTDAEGLPFDDFKKFCADEKPHLIDPYMFNPEDFFAWEADEILKEVKLIPRKTTAEFQQIIKAADDCLGLNREELKKLRWRRLQDLLLPKKVIESGIFSADVVGTAKQRLRDMTNGEEIFTGMARYFVQDVWKLDLS